MTFMFTINHHINIYRKFETLTSGFKMAKIYDFHFTKKKLSSVKIQFILDPACKMQHAFLIIEGN